MKPKKKKSGWFWFILIVFFVIYCGLSIAINSGYYESQLNKKTVMTNEQIKKFEMDIKEGKEIDIENYLGTEKNDYNNNITRLSMKASDNIQKIMTSGISGALKAIGKLFGT